MSEQAAQGGPLPGQGVSTMGLYSCSPATDRLGFWLLTAWATPPLSGAAGCGW